MMKSNLQYTTEESLRALHREWLEHKGVEGEELELQHGEWLSARLSHIAGTEDETLEEEELAVDEAKEEITLEAFRSAIMEDK